MTHGRRQVGIVGSGRIGLGLARLLAEAGHDVAVGSRTPADPRVGDPLWHATTQADAMARDVVVLSLPHLAIAEVLEATGGPRPGAVVVDPANALDTSRLDRFRSALPVPHGRWLQDRVPTAHVVRAFSHVQDELLVSRARRQPDVWAVAVAGDDQAAVDVVCELVRDVRYVPVVVGGLDDSAGLDPGGDLFCRMLLPGMVPTAS